MDGARSAEPPISHGTRGAMAFSTLPLVSRPACAFRVGRVVGEVGVPVVGQLTALHLVELVGQVGVLGPVGGEQLVPCIAQLGAAVRR